MPNFFLVDHSFKDWGGHHWDYAINLLGEVERNGWSVVLATHRALRSTCAEMRPWHVLPLFRHTAYKYVVDWEELQTPRGGLKHLLQRRTRRKRQHDFLSSCARLFAQVPINPGDQVFFPTLLQEDLRALAEFLEARPTTSQADWHLQFHYGLGDQLQDARRLELVREYFAPLRRLARTHRLHYYTTTEQLAEQYNRVGFGRFSVLPYQISPKLRPVGARPAAGPLRLVCAGGPRAEKGFDHLQQIVAELWPELRSGQLQLIVQAKARRWSPATPRFIVPTPEPCPARFLSVEELARGGVCELPIAYVSHPLVSDEYVTYLQSADAGLFLYDAASYRNRCSGVMIEMLALGTPVIVPGQCWLSEQVERAGSGLGPSKAIGLVADSPSDVPARVRQLMQQYVEHRRACQEFSVEWRRTHSPAATLNTLVHKAQQRQAA